MGCSATFCCAAVSDVMKASAASLMGLVETPVCCNGNSPGTTCPSVVTPRNGSAKALSALAYVFFHPSGMGSTMRLAEPGRGGLMPYPPYLPGMMAIVGILLRLGNSPITHFAQGTAAHVARIVQNRPDGFASDHRRVLYLFVHRHKPEGCETVPS